MTDVHVLSNRVRPFALCALFAAVAPPSCSSGTETDNPVIGFDASDCKSDRGVALTLAGSELREKRATFGAGDEYAGLNCFAWRPEGEDGLHLEVFNMIGGCHVVWENRPARWNGATLELTVAPDGCAVAGCGSCEYDLAFELADLDLDEALPIALYQDHCSSEREAPRASLTLPLDKRREGILCRGGAWSFGPECGTVHGRICSEAEGRPDAPACQDGLVRDESSDPEVCLTACTADSDCPLAVESCQSGMCRLRETF